MKFNHVVADDSDNLCPAKQEESQNEGWVHDVLK